MGLLRVLAFFYLVFWIANATRAYRAARQMSNDEAQRRAGGVPPPRPRAQRPFAGFDDEVFRSWEQGFRQQRQAPPRPPPTSHAQTPYDILGVRQGASESEIRRAYQAKVRQYHPDRTADLAPDLRDLAEKRAKEITNAYNTLKRQR